MQRSHTNILNRASTERDISPVGMEGRGRCHYLGDVENCEKMGMLMRAKTHREQLHCK